METKTIRASELLKEIEDRIKEYGDLPVFISDGQGELAMSKSAIRFSNTLGFKKKQGDKEMSTLTGRYFIVSNL